VTRSIKRNRRAAMLLAGVAAASMLLSGCSAGQVAETARKVPSLGGVNAQSENGDFKVRNVSVDYLSPEGYPAGGTAPLTVAIFNDSVNPVTVTISSDNADSVTLGGEIAGRPGPESSPAASPSEPAETPGAPSPDAQSPGAEPSPSLTGPGATASPVTPSPSQPATATGPASVEIPAYGYVSLTQESGDFVQLVGLKEALRPGGSVTVTFDFGNGQVITTVVPVATPLSPAPRNSPVTEGEEAGSHD